MASQATSQWSEDLQHTPEVFEVLKRCATDGSTISYRDLAERVGGVGPSSVFPALDYIRDDVCLPFSLPWLWVLAVNQGTGRPGNGAWRNTGVRLRDDEHWGEIIGRVYAYDWTNVKLGNKQSPVRWSDVPCR